MEAEFDPYQHWLGIPKSEQPANHYRLLGLSVGEADPTTIQNAADERMRHLRTFQIGKHSDLSQKLLNEVAAAKLLLLNPKRRAAYDLKLAEPPLPPPPADPPPLQVPSLDSPPLHGEVPLRLELSAATPALHLPGPTLSLPIPPTLSVGTQLLTPPPAGALSVAPDALSVAPDASYAPYSEPGAPADDPAAFPSIPAGRLRPLMVGLAAAAAIVGLGWAFSLASRPRETAQPEAEAASILQGGGLGTGPSAPSGVPPHFPPQPVPPGGFGPGGFTPPGDGRFRRLPDGRLLTPDGRMILPDGRRLLPDGRVVDQHDPAYGPPVVRPPSTPARPNPLATPPASPPDAAPSLPKLDPDLAAPVKPLVPPTLPRLDPELAPPVKPPGLPPAGLPGTDAPDPPSSNTRPPETQTPSSPPGRTPFPNTPFGPPGGSMPGRVPPGPNTPFGPTSPPPPSAAPTPPTAAGDGFANFAKEGVVELLPWVDADRDALAWPPYRRVGGTIQSYSSEFCRCFLPFPAPSEFRLVVEVTRESYGQPFVVAYTWGGGTGGVMLSLRENGGEILGRGGRTGFGGSLPWNGPTLTLGKRRRVAFTVRLRRVVVEVDGAVVLDQPVDLAQFDLARETFSVPVNYPWRVMLGSNHAADRIHRVAWASLDSEKRSPTPPPPSAAFLTRMRELFSEPGQSVVPKETGRRHATSALQAAEVATDLSEKEHLFGLAKDWAVELVDADLAFEALDRRFEHFAGDPFEAKAEAFGELVRKADGTQSAELFRLGVPLFRMAVRAERAAAAERIVSELAILAGKSVSTAAAVNAAKQSLKLIREQSDKLGRDLKPARDARVKLAGDPEDKAAHLVLGRYYCFVREDWSRGAEHLRQGDNPQLAKLAEQELNPPISGPDRAALADGWKKAVDGAILAHKPAILRRCAMWRQAAARRLEGVPQAAERKKIEDLGPFNLDPWDASTATAFRDKVFFFHPYPTPPQRGWKAAEEWARQRGGHLACVRATLEADFIAAYAASFGSKNAYFLGGTDDGLEGKWRWVDGTPFAFARWEGGAPNNFGGRENFLTARMESKQWNDAPEEHDGASIVQWPLPKEWPKEP